MGRKPYGGELNELVVFKLDHASKAGLIEQAEKDQSSLSVIARRAIKTYLATCQASTNEVHNA